MHDEGKRQNQSSIRNHEVVNCRNRVQQEIGAAVVRDRNLVNGMLNERQPIGQQDDAYTSSDERRQTPQPASSTPATDPATRSSRASR